MAASDPLSNAFPTKRPRAEPQQGPNTDFVNGKDDPFRPTLQRKVVDIHEHGNDPEGFIQVEVCMKWPNQPRIQALAVENGQTVKFEIVFRGLCAEHFKAIGLGFDFRDALYLSLEGATIQKKSVASKGCLPMIVIYSDGVRLKFNKKKRPLETGPLVDYWPCDYTLFLAKMKASHAGYRSKV